MVEKICQVLPNLLTSQIIGHINWLFNHICILNNLEYYFLWTRFQIIQTFCKESKCHKNVTIVSPFLCVHCTITVDTEVPALHAGSWTRFLQRRGRVVAHLWGSVELGRSKSWIHSLSSEIIIVINNVLMQIIVSCHRLSLLNSFCPLTSKEIENNSCANISPSFWVCQITGFSEKPALLLHWAVVTPVSLQGTYFPDNKNKLSQFPSHFQVCFWNIKYKFSFSYFLINALSINFSQSLLNFNQG